jgi:hypothetical protein
MAIVIEAVRFAGGNFDEVEAFVGADAEFRGGELVVGTSEGPLHVADGEWILRSGGRFTSCPALIFKALEEAFTGRRQSTVRGA